MSLKYGYQASEGAHLLPLNSNFDYLNSLNFSKGCYVGQEITSRANFVGLTRKRLAVYLASRSLLEEYDEHPNDNVALMKDYVADHFEEKIEPKESPDGKILILGELIRQLSEPCACNATHWRPFSRYS